MANAFTITISAVDKATATVRKVNDSISRLTRPFEEVGKSFKSLGRELGFEKIGKNLGNIGREAGSAARSVGMIVAPMAAITGVGSVAGIAALAGNWAKLGRSIDSSARGIGISASQLQGFQGAAKMVGIDAGTTTASLDSLATTMQDAQWGRNQGALLMLNKLGIGLKKTKDGAWDVVGQYKAIANAVASQKSPQVQALIANNLGLGGMLPFLREGAEGIERYEATVRRLGYVMSDSAVRQGKEFSQSMAGLSIAVDGTKNAIGDKLIPVMKPLVDQFTNWLSVNRELIATNIGEWAKGFATWINKIDWKAVGEGILEFGRGVGKAVDWLGGWENAALVLVGVMNAGLIVSVASLGLSLGRAGLGVLAFTRLLVGWKAAAVGAEVATNAAAASAARGSAARLGLAGAFLSLSSDQSDTARSAADLQSAAMAGDRNAALTLARQQLDHWFLPSPTNESINQRADEISSGRQAGYTPEQMKSIHPDRASANQLFRKLEQQNGLPPNLLDSVWNTESGRGAKMTSSAGAKGHFQFMDPTAAQYGLKNPSNLAESADAAARLYRDLLKGNGGNLDRALAAYNWGQGNLDRKGMGAAPEETRDYIKKVKAQMAGAQVRASEAAPQGPYTQGAVQPGGGTVKVEIEHKNAPDGTKTKVQSAGNVQASSRVAYSGVGAIA
ncbi:lytic transglycosylase domain-containing protein [Pseudomonas chlororaphis]|uniref:lytic transglycosylase domain-containing protein n=1 Tax=Pseudomonas chlororaphis TaxID=587753 RepID=UPI00209B23E2|nr:lytic transglycosylase domain-containing protein [Pseudomonas chlororaphis]MCO7569367.1 lytic transglycosylase domain-containing protein [Pseudomonas chlororaphis]MCO7586788.1 lytic transglycosylase domain-containing protein [Pseudomonas chlororaphis]